MNGDFDVAVTAAAALIALAMTYVFVLILTGAVEASGTLKAVPLLKRQRPAPPADTEAADGPVTGTFPPLPPPGFPA